GIAGLMSIVIGLYALGTLEAPFAGLALIVLSLGLFLADVLVASGHGALTTAAGIAFVLGSLLLFNSEVGGDGLSPFVVFPIVIVTLGFFALMVGVAYRTRRLPPRTGGEGLVGALAVA